MEIGGRRQRRVWSPKKRKVRCLTAMRQIRDMSAKYPDFIAQRRGNEAIWVGRFRPSPACATYSVKIEALSGRRPRVTVVEPELQIPRERWAETHRFSDGTLCLHLPEQWEPDQFIADTIVPWTALWLINYEYWLATGEWHGGGQHPK